MKIGIFGGGFNPVHKGHLHLISQLIDACKIDKLILIPTANPPHKSGEEFVSCDHRINMLKLAIKDLDNDILNRLEISDIEFKLKGKSYTYNTLIELKTIYPNDEMYLFMGSDQFLYFKKWYKYKEILSLCKVIAIAREDSEINLINSFLLDNREELFSAQIISVKPVEASSTEIRNRIKNKLSISGLVTNNVENYILEKGLYNV